MLGTGDTNTGDDFSPQVVHSLPGKTNMHNLINGVLEVRDGYFEV